MKHQLSSAEKWETLPKPSNTTVWRPEGQLKISLPHFPGRKILRHQPPLLWQGKRLLPECLFGVCRFYLSHWPFPVVPPLCPQLTGSDDLSYPSLSPYKPLVSLTSQGSSSQDPFVVRAQLTLSVEHHAMTPSLPSASLGAGII